MKKHHLQKRIKRLELVNNLRTIRYAKQVIIRFIKMRITSQLIRINKNMISNMTTRRNSLTETANQKIKVNSLVYIVYKFLIPDFRFLNSLSCLRDFVLL